MHMADMNANFEENIIAIKIGLNNSSFAFSTRLALGVDRDITLQTWNSDRVPGKTLTSPTAVLFNDNKEFHSFGYEARSAYDGLLSDGEEKGWFYFTEFTKQLIDREIQKDVVFQDIEGKTMIAEKVLSAIIAYFKATYEKLREQRNTCWIFTTPMAIDNESYRNLLIAAAVMAGIDERQISIASEAEAYTMYCQSVSFDELKISKKAKHVQDEIQKAATKFATVEVNGPNIYATLYFREDGGGLTELCKVSFGGTAHEFLEEECLEVFNAICGETIFQMYCQLFPNSHDLIKSKLRSCAYMKTMPERFSIRLPVNLSEFYENATGKCFGRTLMLPRFNEKVTVTTDKIKIGKKALHTLLRQGINKTLTCLEGLMKMVDVQETNVFLLFGRLSITEIFLDAVTQSYPMFDFIAPAGDSYTAVLQGAVLYGKMLESNIPTIRTNVIKHFRTEIPRELLGLNEKSIEIYKTALSEGSEAAHNIRVMVVGHFGVGKTTLTKRMFEENVYLGKQESTEGIDVHVRKCKVSLEDGRWHVLDEDDRKIDTYRRLAKLFSANSAGRTTETDEHLDDDIGSVQHNRDSFNLSTSHGMENQEDGRKLQSKHSIDTVGIKDTSQDLYSKNQPKSRLSPSSIQEVYPTSRNQFQTSDDIFRDLKEIVAQAWDFNSGVRPTEMADLSVWDFAGQFAFYSTHQVFLSRRAIYLLVINLSKSIDDEVPDRCFIDSQGSRLCHVSDFVEFWLNSIHEYCGGTESENTPVILVGTFADKIDQARRQELAKSYFRKLRRKLAKTETFEHLAEEIIIDNSTVDPNIDALKTTIWKLASKQSYWGEQKPANYIILEKTLMKLRNEGLKVLLKKDLREINKAMPVPIASDEGLDVFLNFQHETGYLLYFNDTLLKDYVLLEPQWLVDAFKCLITADTFCKKRVMYNKWLEFNEKAILTRELIDMAWGEADDSFSKHKVVLLLFMEKLGLIAKPLDDTESCSFQTKEEHYFAPCVLKQGPPLDIIETKNTSVSTSTSRICFTTSSRFIPSAVFNKLLAACLAKWQLVQQNEIPLIFCGCGVFKIDETHFMYVHFFDNIIQMWITRFSQRNPYPESKICEEVKKFVTSYLRTNARMASKMDVFVKCPNEQPLSNKALFRSKELLEKPEVVCSFHGEPHSVISSDITRYWYGNKHVYGNAADGRIEIDALDRLLTDKEINRIAHKIGKDYQSLGRELGLTQTEIDHLEMDYGTSLNRINGMLIKWRSKAGENATIQNLKQAMYALGMADIFYVCASTP
ncbi:uncharacterized protein LOC123536268 [Mercenaria mercenaria]|uniref:uncharacterized protein LOC123536268 n=1 Tax=Mercenaria mercenaria TaxID=6596 RepID=UPI00234F662D|nr:uncharacterized protein LOC123536268 [Mercenaria mercenaria]